VLGLLSINVVFSSVPKSIATPVLHKLSNGPTYSSPIRVREKIEDIVSKY